jgi:hypothetical protein
LPRVRGGNEIWLNVQIFGVRAQLRASLAASRFSRPVSRDRSLNSSRRASMSWSPCSIASQDL